MSKDTKFTPGPWEWFGNYLEGADFAVVIAPDVHCVRHCLLDADAHLIAAAPDLYAALEEALVFASDCGYAPDRGTEGRRVYDTIRAALAKARGEQP